MSFGRPALTCHEVRDQLPNADSTPVPVPLHDDAELNNILKRTDAFHVQSSNSASFTAFKRSMESLLEKKLKNVLESRPLLCKQGASAALELDSVVEHEEESGILDDDVSTSPSSSDDNEEEARLKSDGPRLRRRENPVDDPYDEVECVSDADEGEGDRERHDQYMLAVDPTWTFESESEDDSDDPNASPLDVTQHFVIPAAEGAANVIPEEIILSRKRRRVANGDLDKLRSLERLHRRVCLPLDMQHARLFFRRLFDGNIPYGIDNEHALRVLGDIDHDGMHPGSVYVPDPKRTSTSAPQWDPPQPHSSQSRDVELAVMQQQVLVAQCGAETLNLVTDLAERAGRILNQVNYRESISSTDAEKGDRFGQELRENDPFVKEILERVESLGRVIRDSDNHKTQWRQWYVEGKVYENLHSASKHVNLIDRNENPQSRQTLWTLVLKASRNCISEGTIRKRRKFYLLINAVPGLFYIIGYSPNKFVQEFGEKEAPVTLKKAAEDMYGSDTNRDVYRLLFGVDPRPPAP